jgi:hypothetical protein
VKTAQVRKMSSHQRDFAVGSRSSRRTLINNGRPFS